MDEKFQSMKETLQKLLNKHLPTNNQISIMEFDKEEVWFLCRLILEKDNKKRELIRKEIDERIKRTKYEYETEFIEIQKHKELYDNYFKVFNEKEDLLEDIELEKSMDNNLKKI